MDEPLSAERGGARYFYHANHLGSIRHLTDASGAVVNTYDYDAFGKATVAVASVPQPFGFTGREADPESGLMHYRARAYDPSTGRFLQEDPIWFEAGDLNVYAYVFGSPIGWVDPFGLSASEYGGAAAAGAASTSYVHLVAAAVSCQFDAVSSALRHANAGRTRFNVADASRKCLVNAAEDIVISAVVGGALGPLIKFAWLGREIKIGKNWRLAPFGNRTGPEWFKKWPHYHRRPPGGAVPNQGIGRHRPWEHKPGDGSFLDRF